MRLLSIETSCDETGVSILSVKEEGQEIRVSLEGNALLSQIDIHKEYGGVYPALAKRAHAENLVPLLEAALEEAGLNAENRQAIPEDTRTYLGELLAREAGLSAALLAFAEETEKPAIDAIAVTYGPGLEPALWVGVNFARALAKLWDIPVIGVNHLEGHIMASLMRPVGERAYTLSRPELPLVSLVVSGGHTELVLTRDWLTYERIGETRDDAVGEAYDKVARMLGLPYPGGPEVSRLADEAREAGLERGFTLPRPMLDSSEYDFSFSGLKTAVLYLLKGRDALSDDEKRMMAREFEDACAEVLSIKTLRALDAHGARSLVLGGGVSANAHLRRTFTDALAERGIPLHLPEQDLTGDNSVMIGMAGYLRVQSGAYSNTDTLAADGNLSLV